MGEAGYQAHDEESFGEQNSLLQESQGSSQGATIDFHKALKTGNWNLIFKTPSVKRELVALQQGQELSRALLLLDPAHESEEAFLAQAVAIAARWANTRGGMSPDLCRVVSLLDERGVSV